MPTFQLVFARLLPVLALAAAAATAQPAIAPATPANPATLASLAPGVRRDVVKIFAEACASCHGAQLQGGQAPSMLDDEWAHGGDDDALARSIRDGYVDKGMPGWASVLTDRDIRAMVIFIREQRARAKRTQTVFARPDSATVTRSKLHAFRLETWVDGVTEPWSLAFLPDGRAVVTEKRGRLFVIEQGRLNAAPVTGLPRVDTGGQAGLFDVVPHPRHAENGWLYLAFSDPAQNADGRNVSLTRIIRGRLRDGALADQQTIFRGPLEYHRPAGGVHFGGRLVFDRAGDLYFSIGERGQGPNSQDLARPTGKIHRVRDDGAIPADNPFAGDPKADRTIWSFGHRNPQGLALHPVTGDIWSAEHGPRGGDELNRIRRGLNYGWPLVTFGMNYNGSPMVDAPTKPGLEPPVHYWVPSIAVCGINFYAGDRFPRWKHQLFVASLAAEELHRLELADGRVVDEEILFKGLGRIRHVIGGPDGLLYVLLPQRIARLVPAD